MKGFVLISAICLQLGWNYARGYSTGVGAFSSQDSSGRRYEGTYGLRDGEVVDVKGDLPPNFKPEEFIPNFEPDNFIGFFPEYFRNLENILQEAFQANLDSQKIALDAAHKAYDLTSNQAAGYSPNLTPSRFHVNSFNDFPNIPGPQFPPGFPFEGGLAMNRNGASSIAFAGASAGPGYNKHVAAINPPNPDSPNVFKSSRSSSNPGGFKSVSVSSFSSSSDVNGRRVISQGADTKINDNGKVESYSVRSP